MAESGSYFVSAEIDRVLMAARDRILGVATDLETGLEEAVTAYWTDFVEEEMEFFIEAVLRNSTANQNLERLKAIVRHYLDDDTYDSLWTEIGEVINFRNVVVHRWRGGIISLNQHADVARLRRVTTSGKVVERDVSQAETTRLATLGAAATIRLEVLQETLAELGRQRRSAER